MKISVALCTFNGEKYLEEQLQSFSAQARLPDEIVACDDGSADRTRDILKDFQQSAPFPVKVVLNPQNLGLIKNFEKAISLCSGDIICLSDQDDVWENNKLSVVEQIFDSDEEVGLVYSDAKVADENLADTGATLWQYLDRRSPFIKDFNKGRAFDRLLNDGYFLGACMAFRAKYKALFLPLPDDVYYVHDNWIALAIAGVAKVKLVETPLLRYRQHNLQTSSGVAGYQTSFTRSFVEGARRKNDHEIVIAQLKLLQERLKGYPEARAESQAKLAAAIKHKEGRANLPANFLTRAGSVFREFSGGNYSLYSNGFKSALKDIFSAK